MKVVKRLKGLLLIALGVILLSTFAMFPVGVSAATNIADANNLASWKYDWGTDGVGSYTTVINENGMRMENFVSGNALYVGYKSNRFSGVNVSMYAKLNLTIPSEEQVAGDWRYSSLAVTFLNQSDPNTNEHFAAYSSPWYVSGSKQPAKIAVTFEHNGDSIMTSVMLYYSAYGRGEDYGTYVCQSVYHVNTGATYGSHNENNADASWGTISQTYPSNGNWFDGNYHWFDISLAPLGSSGVQITVKMDSNIVLIHNLYNNVNSYKSFSGSGWTDVAMPSYCNGSYNFATNTGYMGFWPTSSWKAGNNTSSSQCYIDIPQLQIAPQGGSPYTRCAKPNYNITANTSASLPTGETGVETEVKLTDLFNYDGDEPITYTAVVDSIANSTSSLVSGDPIGKINNGYWLYTPSKKGNYRIKFTATTADGKTATNTLTYRVSGTDIAEPELPPVEIFAKAGVEMGPYDLGATVSQNLRELFDYAGTKGITYGVTSDDSPIGSVDASGNWTWTPTSAGSYLIDFKATTSDGMTALNSIRIRIKSSTAGDVEDPNAIYADTSMTLGKYTLGETLTETLADFFIYGGSGTVTYTVTCNGNALGSISEGVWTWTPSATGIYTVEFKGTTSDSKTAVNTMLVCIEEAAAQAPVDPTITANSSITLANAKKGIEYGIKLSELFVYTGTNTVTYQVKLNGNNIGSIENGFWYYTASQATTLSIKFIATVSATNFAESTLSLVVEEGQGTVGDTSVLSVNTNASISSVVEGTKITRALADFFNYTGNGSLSYRVTYLSNEVGMVDGANWEWIPENSGVYEIVITATATEGFSVANTVLVYIAEKTSTIVPPEEGNAPPTNPSNPGQGGGTSGGNGQVENQITASSGCSSNVGVTSMVLPVVVLLGAGIIVATKGKKEE